MRNGDDASTPAPPEDQIEGSKKNPKGSASGDSDEDIKFLNKQRNLFKIVLMSIMKKLKTKDLLLGED